jgi:Fe-S cluster assembly protein SufD
MSEQSFLIHLYQHFQHQEQDALHSFREKSWERLSELGLPTKSHEAFRYVSLRELYQSSFEFSHPIDIDKSSFTEAILPECKHSHLVFIDGRFAFNLSDVSALPLQTVVLPLDAALRSHGAFLQHRISHSLKEENDPFALINLALHPKGAFFYLPPKLEIEPPVQVLHLLTDGESIVTAPRLYLTIGAHSRIRWISTAHHFQPRKSHFIVPAIEISLEEGSALDLLSAIDCPRTSWYMESVRVLVKKNARFHSLNFTCGAKAVRQSFRVNLKEENGEANLNGLWMLKANRSAHTHVVIEHEAPFTHSMQLFKGVLSDASQSSFEGKILVRPEAQKTEAYQLNKNLILGQGAVANSKPNLEIFADDVKASHGATISQLDPEQLFYFKTRGIESNEAGRLLIKGFCREMIEQIPYDSLLKKMWHQIENDYEHQNFSNFVGSS